MDAEYLKSFFGLRKRLKTKCLKVVGFELALTDDCVDELVEIFDDEMEEVELSCGLLCEASLVRIINELPNNLKKVSLAFSLQASEKVVEALNEYMRAKGRELQTLELVYEHLWVVGGEGFCESLGKCEKLVKLSVVSQLEEASLTKLTKHMQQPVKEVWIASLLMSEGVEWISGELERLIHHVARTVESLAITVFPGLGEECDITRLSATLCQCTELRKLYFWAVLPPSHAEALFAPLLRQNADRLQELCLATVHGSAEVVSTVYLPVIEKVSLILSSDLTSAHFERVLAHCGPTLQVLLVDGDMAHCSHFFTPLACKKLRSFQHLRKLAVRVQSLDAANLCQSLQEPLQELEICLGRLKEVTSFTLPASLKKLVIEPWNTKEFLQSESLTQLEELELRQNYSESSGSLSLNFANLRNCTSFDFDYEIEGMVELLSHHRGLKSATLRDITDGQRVSSQLSSVFPYAKLGVSDGVGMDWCRTALRGEVPIPAVFMSLLTSYSHINHLNGEEELDEEVDDDELLRQGWARLFGQVTDEKQIELGRVDCLCEVKRQTKRLQRVIKMNVLGLCLKHWKVPKDVRILIGRRVFHVL